MHKKASLTLGLLIMAVSAWGIYTASAWPLKAKLFPLVVGIPLFLLAAAEVLWLLLGSTPEGESPDFQISKDQPQSVVTRRTLAAVAWVLGFFAAIVLTGFPIAVPLFVLAYLRLQGGESWVMSVVFAAAVWAVFYGLFDRLLHLPFPAGWIQDWLGWA